MQIIKDESTYDDLQRYLVHVIARDVRDCLREAAASGASLEAAVSAITLGVSTIIDGSRDMKHDNEQVVPVLMFGLMDKDDAVEGAITNGESSSMHEYALAAAAEVVKA
jgi:hypothetical protein